MPAGQFDLIPEERREPVRSALGQAFGRGPFGPLRPVTTGNSGALIYQIEAAGRPFLLRLDKQGDDAQDQHAAYASMEVAAAAGIAPPVRYADARAGVAIVDFLNERPLRDFPGGPARLAGAVGELIGRLQGTAPFPSAGQTYPAMLRTMFDRLRACGLFGDGSLDAHRDAFERIREIYPWGETSVSSHIDPHPGNFLFDGERLWLIDWETASCNDAMIDVAIVTNYFANTVELEDILLHAWCSPGPDARKRAKLELMRAFALIFYAAAPNGLSNAGEREPEFDLTAPTPAEFWSAVNAGRLVLGRPDTVVLGRKVALRAFLDRTRTPSFTAAYAAIKNA